MTVNGVKLILGMLIVSFFVEIDLVKLKMKIDYFIPRPKKAEAIRFSIFTSGEGGFGFTVGSTYALE